MCEGERRKDLEVPMRLMTVAIISSCVAFLLDGF